ncbi:MAG: c-type cytochrome [Rhodanobacter sp.]
MMKRLLLRTLLALVVVVVVLAGFVWARSGYLLQRTWRVDEVGLTLPTDAVSIANGRHLAVTRGCTDCHGQDMGGTVVMSAPLIGQMAAPNLTRGKDGVVSAFTVVDWERAIRHGVGPDGHGLLLMPSDEMSGLTDGDTADLIAWLRRLPPVERASGRAFVGPVGRVLLAFGKFPLIAADRIDQHAAHVARITPAANASYGRYLVQGCSGCHGPHLSGGAIPGMPPQAPKAANLTPDPLTGLGHWSKADFYRALRQGRRPDGSMLDPFMPWQSIRMASDTELDALWAYLRTVPARPAGQR